MGGGVGTEGEGAVVVLGVSKVRTVDGMITQISSKLRSSAGSNTRTGTAASVSDEMWHGHLSTSQQVQCPGPRVRQTGQPQPCAV